MSYTLTHPEKHTCRETYGRGSRGNKVLMQLRPEPFKKGGEILLVACLFGCQDLNLMSPGNMPGPGALEGTAQPQLPRSN
jgi:hypothetical protein